MYLPRSVGEVSMRWAFMVRNAPSVNTPARGRSAGNVTGTKAVGVAPGACTPYRAANSEFT
jgi:hypothetical protein